MKTIINIKMDNAAFENDPMFELAQILRSTASDIESNAINIGDEVILRDYNGNTVGSIEVLS